ncbi:hypothetical protein DdX_16466 [Ditylenchus destructor]|uniref:Uncharacterized protein n=1 Tax=Ditylenchus destructor TaxID=166010 RepID=A0AAD4R022_9BILA|nr:hypothetical protein DdX_16466 [Ditylenchus destructor]
MDSRAFIRIFILHVILYFCISAVGATIGTFFSKAKAGLNNAVDKIGGNKEKIELFTYGVPDYVNPPETLVPFINHLAPEIGANGLNNIWHQRAKDRVEENLQLRDALQAEVEKIFPCGKMLDDPKNLLPKSDKDYIYQFSINSDYLKSIGPVGSQQEQIQPSDQGMPNYQEVRTLIQSKLKELALDLIRKELPGITVTGDTIPEIKGEPALRIGAELYRSLFFVDAAHYKGMKNEDYIEIAYRDEVIRLAKGKVKDVDKYVETVRNHRLHEIIERFNGIWKAVEKIMDVLANYRSDFYIAQAEFLVHKLKNDKRNGEKRRANASIQKHQEYGRK